VLVQCRGLLYLLNLDALLRAHLPRHLLVHLIHCHSQITPNAQSAPAAVADRLTRWRRHCTILSQLRWPSYVLTELLIFLQRVDALALRHRLAHLGVGDLPQHLGRGHVDLVERVRAAVNLRDHLRYTQFSAQVLRMAQ
jgi:hypothetical protein